MKNWNPTPSPLRDLRLFSLCLLAAGGAESKQLIYMIMYVADVARS